MTATTTRRRRDKKPIALFVVPLPCKEIENLLLLTPESLENAAKRAAERRQLFTSQNCPVPTLQEIEEYIDAVTAGSTIRGMVENNWVANRLRPKTDGGDLSQRQQEFARQWNDPKFRRRHGPGKEVLKRLRKWLQDEWGISLSSPFECYEATQELKDVFKKIQEHFQRHAGNS